MNPNYRPQFNQNNRNSRENFSTQGQAGSQNQSSENARNNQLTAAEKDDALIWCNELMKAHFSRVKSKVDSFKAVQKGEKVQQKFSKPENSEPKIIAKCKVYNAREKSRESRPEISQPKVSEKEGQEGVLEFTKRFYKLFRGEIYTKLTINDLTEFDSTLSKTLTNKEKIA